MCESRQGRYQDAPAVAFGSALQPSPSSLPTSIFGLHQPGTAGVLRLGGWDRRSLDFAGDRRTDNSKRAGGAQDRQKIEPPKGLGYSLLTHHPTVAIEVAKVAKKGFDDGQSEGGSLFWWQGLVGRATRPKALHPAARRQHPALDASRQKDVCEDHVRKKSVLRCQFEPDRPCQTLKGGWTMLQAIRDGS